jgi:alanine dehydrogenase
MDIVKVALIKEGKVPPDKRVALTPVQCVTLMQRYPNLKIVVQRSAIRAITDSEYAAHGIELRDEVSDCHVLVGVKEVNIADLIPEKTYLFFSHTFKKQPYNRELLRAILSRRIRLIDYEVLTYPNGGRVIGFGRYAGIVGAYNTMRAYGLKSGRYSLKPAHQCHDRKEVEQELLKVTLPDDFRLVMTGMGRVGMGAREIVDLLDIEQVNHEDFLNVDYGRPVFTHIDVQDYHRHKDPSVGFDRKHFFAYPDEYISTFPRYAHRAEVYIACHYWSSKAPFLFTRKDAKDPGFRLKVVGDISCDIDGPVASTIRPSTIADPLYGYDPLSERETDFMNPDAIGVMAIDNLPCELPRDASEDFGQELMEKVFPHLLGSDEDKIIWRATQTLFSGELAPHFAYLQDYVNGTE